MEFEITTCFYDALTEQEWCECRQVTIDAFKEHKERGLQMYPCSITLDQLKQYLKDCHLFVVRHRGKIVAFRGVQLLKSGSSLYGSGRLVAVSPECRGKGVGKLLFKMFEDFATEAGCKFLQTDTSCEAKSSQAYHHSCGFEDWRYGSWQTTNYYTIIMRKLLPSGRKYNPLLRRVALSLSYVCCHLMYDKYGNERIIGKMVNIPYRWVKKCVKRLLWGILGKRR